MAKISVSLSLEESLVARIDEVAELEGVRRSWVVQKVVAGWCDQRDAAERPEPRRPEGKPPGVGRRPGSRKSSGTGTNEAAP